MITTRLHVATDRIIVLTHLVEVPEIQEEDPMEAVVHLVDQEEADDNTLLQTTNNH